MRKVLASLSVIGLMLGAAGLINTANAAQEVTLAAKHGAMWPKSDGFVVKNQCLKCHGDYAKLAKKTEMMDPNPHRSHLGAVNCTDCHKPDLAKPELMCNSCHQFKIQVKKAK